MRKIILLFIFIFSSAAYTFSADMTRYGDGSDGDRTISSNWTMSRDYQWNNLTVNSGVTLNTAGYIIKASDTLTNNGIITDSSSGGAGGVGGSGGNGAPAGRGSSAGNGSPGSPGIDSGGTGGTGGGGGGSASNWIGSLTVAAAGGNGGNGGVGGKGGGNVVIYASTFNNAGVIHADGFTGTDGFNGSVGNYAVGRYVHWMDSSGGGGGGGDGGNGGNGGTIKISYHSLISIGIVRANGGFGGNPGSGGPGGAVCIYKHLEEEWEGDGGIGGGIGGKGEIDIGRAGTAGTSGSVGNRGSVGTITWQPYTNSLKFRIGDRIVIIAAEPLSASHKLRFKGAEVVYGIPLVYTNDPNVSPIRIYDNGAIKALPEVK